MAEDSPQVETPKPAKRRRLRRRWIALIVVAAVIVVAVVASFVTAHYTSRSSFCNSCHEMEPYYASWQGSTHAQAQCRDCHIPPEFVPYVKTKLFSLREVWVHVAGNAVAPLAVTREIPNSNCLACHKLPATVALSNASFSHEIHQAQHCITCHVRLVHRDVNPPYYQSPAAMASCLGCHDGKTAPSQCSKCHTPGHEPRGECSTCHNMESWSGASGAHPFPRTGGHAGLNCTDCHVNKPGVALIPGTELPKADPACVSCHGDHHGGLTDCATCHTPAGWTPPTFRHPQVGEHIPAGERALNCVDCHPDGYGTHSCLKCHATNAGGGGGD